MDHGSVGDARSARKLPDQSGRTALVTGANTGVGFEVARALACHGATVVLACRDADRARNAAARIGLDAPKADVRIEILDLASLASVRRAADRINRDHPRIDLLVNNAGVMWTPRELTEDGFEKHLGVNHLGHFALTGLILPRLTPTPGSRIVVLSSPAHRRGIIDFEDLQSSRRYRPAKAYAQSKLANILFAYELQRRLEAAGAPTIALAAHPGGARSELNRHMPFLFRGESWGIAGPITHPADRGAHGSGATSSPTR
jgi:NAD(P)-dependent dehydrogenase (short-subunit alcohol dehydrogenase family)